MEQIFCIVMYIQLKQIIEKVNVGWDLVLFVGCWLDAGRSECKFAVSCKKGMGLCWLKKVEKSGNSPERSLLFHWKIELWHFDEKKNWGEILKRKKLNTWIHNMHLVNRKGEFSFHADFKSIFMLSV